MDIKEFLYIKSLPKFTEVIQNMVNINQDSTYK